MNVLIIITAICKAETGTQMEGERQIEQIRERSSIHRFISQMPVPVRELPVARNPI